MAAQKEPKSPLTRLQLDVCADDFAGLMSMDKVAEKHGISRTAIKNWQKLPAYQAEYQRLNEEYRRGMHAGLRALGPKALAVLAHAVDLDAGHKIADMLRGADTVLRTTGVDTPAPAPVAAVAVVTTAPAAIADDLEELLTRLRGTSSPAPDEIDDEGPADG